ncbi:MAG TPA: hypothetical protein VHY09_03425 [Candidatus Methylacidiphilales bacterium]|nr:hypothetical protein [Candidatus Methylacidiphilales bacterium]
MDVLPIKYPRDDFFGGIKPRGFFVLTLAILALVVLYLELRYPSPSQQEVSQAQLFEWIKAGGVTRLINQPDASTGIRYLTGIYSKPGTSAVIGFKVPVDLQLDPYLLSEIKQAGYTGTIETVNNTNVVLPLFLNLAPLILFLIVVIFTFRAVGRWLYKAING